MKKILFSAILAAALLGSCTSRQDKKISPLPETPKAVQTPRYYVITDHKNKTEDENIPEWVFLCLDGDFRELEALDAYEGRYVFISRNEGNNFTALTQWNEGFLPELDFPRLAAARIEARFSIAVPYPDDEYGSFFEAMIRASSDARWTGAVREDDFWVSRKYFPLQDRSEIASPVNDTYEFLILVTIEKTDFASQLTEIFRNIKPSPAPTRSQNAAANRVKDNFFSSF